MGQDSSFGHEPKPKTMQISQRISCAMMESMDIYGDFTSQEIQPRVELLAAPQFLF